MTRKSIRGKTRTYDILLIESEPDDVAPFIDAFESTEYTESVHVVADGTKALDFLNQRGEYSDAPRPDLIILDTHISGSSGTEILAELDGHAELKPVPVVVVTASEAEDDIVQSYTLNANALVTKPDTPDEFEELAEAIEQFWLRVAKLPPK